MEKNSLGGFVAIVAINPLCDLHFLDVLIKFKHNLQRLLFWVDRIIVIHLHCQRKTIVGNLATLALYALFDVCPRLSVQMLTMRNL